MKHIVFILGSYYPRPSAVGVCAEKIISRLAREFRVTVVASKSDAQLKDFEMFGDVSLFRVETQFQGWINKFQSESAEFSRLNFLALLGLRVCRTIGFLFRRTSIDPQLVDCYASKLEAIDEKDKIDVIIPVVFPFEAALAAIRFKGICRVNCQVAPYIFDNFSLSVSLHRFRLNRRLKLRANRRLEQMVLNVADRLFIMQSQRLFFESIVPRKIISKMEYLEHPLLIEKPGLDSAARSGKIVFTYAGGLFRGVRSAVGCIAVLEQLSRKIDLLANFYCFGSGAAEVERHARKSPQTFGFFGSVDKSVADDAISKADVLISIGDAEGRQVSSKIFDYLSMGKPILHFSFVRDCVNSQLLSTYPLAYTIFVPHGGDIEDEALEELTDFIISSRDRTLAFSEVADLFPSALPHKTVERFKSFILR